MKNRKVETNLIHWDKIKPSTGPIIFPIYQTSSYKFQSSKIAVRYAQGDETVYVYSRIHNPTISQLEKHFSSIYNSEAAAVFSSGMSSICTTIFTLCKSDDEILTIPNLYGGTQHLFKDIIQKFKINVKYFDPNALEDLLYLITQRTRIVFFETPTNPTLDIVNIKKLVNIVRKVEKELKNKVYIVLDNTIATVINQPTLKFGVDVVIESTTKYLGGHSDLTGGVAVGSKKIIKKIKDARKYIGCMMDPFTAFLLDRSLKTLSLRVNQQNQNALGLAKALEKHRKVTKVLYPGLRFSPYHELAKAQMKGYGGMLTIEVAGGLKNAKKFCDNLRLALNAMSFGGVETSVSIPVLSSHIGLTKEELSVQRITPGMVRISVGIENISDLIQDFYQSLNRLK